jgi:AhpD family alkylhydroperoxidase
MSETSYKELNSETRKLMGNLGKALPKTMQGFQGLHGGAIEDGALDKKTKELIALAIGIKSQCDRCIGMHVAAAKEAGASNEEIQETIGVCTMMGGGPALMYGLHALQALEEL